MKQRERLLITVKTYPAISAQNIETVCTGAINEHGEWRRLYPVAFRYLDQSQQYKLFDVIEVDLDAGKDNRPESRTPNINTLKRTGHLTDWQSRSDWVTPTILSSMQAMLDRKKTLAPVAVSEVVDFRAIQVAADWSHRQKAKLQQDLLFDERKPLEKIPWEFRFVWKDGDSRQYDSLFTSWEVFETFRKYRMSYDKPVEKMREKWLQEICRPTKAVSFFMGNMAGRRQVYMVCGTFHPPKKAISNGTLFG